MAKSKNNEESEHHVVAIRTRLKGSGNLKMSLFDLDDVQESVLVPLVMNPVTRIEPTRLANFQSQRIRLVLYTTELNEYFAIGRILIYAKPVAVEYPG